MKIGIVSKPAHCKTHSAALKSMGHSVVVLGGKPTTIPKSIQLIILRTASCSHGGDATARAWSRKTGLPLIVENGLSGIKRELSELLPEEKHSMAIESEYSNESMKEALTDFVQANAAPLLGSFAYSPPPREDLYTLAPSSWTKAMTERKYKRLGATYAEAVNLLSTKHVGMGDWAEKWRMALAADKPFPTLDFFDEGTFDGKPSLFAFAYILSLPEWAEYDTHYNRTDLKEEYGRLTGKILGNDVVPTVSWWCGKSVALERLQTAEELEESPMETEIPPMKTEIARASSTPSTFQERLDDIEDMLLEAMSAIAELKSRRGKVDLYATLKDLQDLGAKVTIELGGPDET